MYTDLRMKIAYKFAYERSFIWDTSVLAFSLSLYRHPSICILCCGAAMLKSAEERGLHRGIQWRKGSCIRKRCSRLLSRMNSSSHGFPSRPRLFVLRYTLLCAPHTCNFSVYLLISFVAYPRNTLFCHICSQSYYLIPTSPLTLSVI